MGKATFEIPIGTELTKQSKPLSISYTRRTWGIDSWKVRLAKIDTAFTGLTQGLIKREGSEAIRGRVLKPKRAFGVGGSVMDLPGMGYAAEANRFITGQGTVTEQTITAAIQEALDSSPSTHGITLGTVDAFYPVKQPNLAEFDTSLEMLKFEYTNAGLEFDATTFEILREPVDGITSNKMPEPSLRCCFVDIRGRVFVFFSDAANNVKYTSSLDGETWAAATDIGYNSSSARIDVTYDPAEDHMHLSVYSGGATAYYTGTIALGVINFVLETASVFAANRYPRCSFMYETNDDEHLQVIDSANHLWHSEDDGSTWTDDGALTNTGLFLFPKVGSADMYIIEYDAATDILELWEIDHDTRTETYVKDIYDYGAEGDILLYLAGTINHEGTMFIAAGDDDDNCILFSIDSAETVTNTSVSASATHPENMTIWSDNGDAVYVVYSGGAGIYMKKYIAGVYDSVTTTYIDASGYTAQSPIKNRISHNDPGGFVVTGGNQGAAARIVFTLFGPIGIRTSVGASSGSFKTTTVTGDGDFERWGMLSGQQLAGDDIVYDVEDTGDVDLVTGLTLDADLHAAGVIATETSIVIQGTITKSGTIEPYMEELYVNERWTKIDGVTYDYEALGSWLDKLKKTVGGEWDLSSANVLTFVDELGTDYSDDVTLQEGLNCKSITVEDLFDSYANIVLVTDNALITETVRNSSEVTAEGEFWYVLRDTEMDSSGLAWNRGSEAVGVLSQGPKVIHVDFMDNQSGKAISETLDRGDTVQVVSPKTGTTQSARIIELTREFSTSGETVRAILVNAGRAQGVIDYWAELEDIRRNL